MDKRTWIEEFGFAYNVPAWAMAFGADQSWHNEVCPRFVRMVARGWQVSLWVEHPSIDKREFDDSDRFLFVLDRVDDDGCFIVDTSPITLGEFEDETIALAFAGSIQEAAEKAINEAAPKTTAG